MRNGLVRGATIMALLLVGTMQSGCAGPSDEDLQKKAADAADKIHQMLLEKGHMGIKTVMLFLGPKVDAAKDPDAFKRFLGFLADELEARADNETRDDIEGELRTLAAELRAQAGND